MPSSRPDHDRWCDLLVITGLSGFAISQPVLSVLGDHPTLFTSSGVDGVALVVFVLAVAFVPPLVLWGIGGLARTLDDGFGRVVHLVTVGLLVALTTVQVAKRAGLEQSVALAAVSIAVGAAFSIALSRFEPVAMWARYNAVLPPLAVAYFLVASPSGDLVRAASAADEVREPSGDVPSVVMIVLDEFPTKSILDSDGGVDRVRFPNLAAFADGATWYRHHTTLSPFTGSAIPSLLTGNVPRTDEPVWTNYPDNLFTLLAPTHELEVFEAGTGLCGLDSCQPTGASGRAGVGDLLSETVRLWRDRVTLAARRPRALDDFEEEVPINDVGQPDSMSFEELAGGAITKQVPTRIQGFLKTLDDRKGPTLYYLHMMLPHQPFKFYANGQLYEEPDPVGMSLPEDDRSYVYSWNDWSAAIAEQRHLLQAQYTDSLVGQILDAVRRADLYDDSLVVVTADHGVSFERRTDSREPVPRTLDDILYAPLFVKLPHQDEGRIDDSNVMAIDVVPTVAEYLDLEPTWDSDGEVLGSPAISARTTSKLWYDIRQPFFPRLEGVVEFDDAVTFPRPADRWIGPLEDSDEPLAGLEELLDSDGMIGSGLDDARRDDLLTIEIDKLDELRRPPDNGAPLGIVTGRVEGAPPDAEVVLAVDGTVVAGSKFAVDSAGVEGRFAMLLPAGALGAQNDIRATLVVDGEIVEGDVR